MQLIRHLYLQGRCYLVFRNRATGEISTFTFNAQGSRIARTRRYSRA